MSYLSRSYYSGDGTTTDFTVGFAYLQKAHVLVYVNGTLTTAWTWVGDSTIRLTAPAADGAVVLVKRATSPNARIVDYVSPSSLNEDDLDNDSLQGFYLAQEANDQANAGIADDPSTGQYTANGKRVTNLAAPVNDGDAATKGYVKSLAGLDGAGAAADSATAAAASATAAHASEVNAASSATSAAASAASINGAQTTVHKWTATAGQTSFTGASATPALTNGPASANYAVVNVNGRVLMAGEYSMAGVDLTLTFSDIEAGEIVELRVTTGVLTPGTVADGAIGTAKIADYAVTTTKLADNGVTNAKQADMANATIKGRATAGTGDPEDLTPAQVRGLILPANAAGGLVNDGSGNLSWGTTGAWEKITEAAFTAINPLEFKNLSAYRRLRLLVSVYTFTTNISLQLFASHNNGAAYDAGASDYSYAQQYWPNAYSSTQGGSAAGSVNINGINNVAPFNYTLDLWDFNQAVKGRFRGELQYTNGTPVEEVDRNYGTFGVATARDAFKLVANSGTMTGWYLLEGVK